MKEYIIVLPNEKLRAYRYITLFILAINCFVFEYLFFNASDEKLKNILLAGSVISLTALILFLIQFFTNRLTAYRPEISFIIFSLLWIALGKWLIAIFILCFAFIGFYTNRKFLVRFTSGNITYPSFPAKKITWDTVSNVMLKDNILTIDLKNNKLIQAVIEKESADSIDEKSFNDFCKKHL